MRWIAFGSICVSLLATPTFAMAETSQGSPSDTRQEFEAICNRLLDDSIHFGDTNVREILGRLISTQHHDREGH